MTMEFLPDSCAA